MEPGQEANGDNFFWGGVGGGNLFDLVYNNGMLSVLISITSMSQF